MIRRKTTPIELLQLSQLNTRVSKSAFSRYLSRPDMASARPFLKMCSAQREHIQRQAEGMPPMDAREFLDAFMSTEAKVFADTITMKLESAASALGCEMCEMDHSTMKLMPDNGDIPAETAIVFGLVRDGKISLLAMSHEHIFTQGGDGTGYTCRYDENTDFEALFRDRMTPDSFM